MAKTEKGKISVETENLFPIIKKWLYSEHDIFLRELISNAYDAITKLKRLKSLSQYKGKTDKRLINVSIDKPKKTITVSDNGIGMTADEVKKYINQIAFSGAKDFLEKYEKDNKDSQIVGHFGLGFFSAYMVSDSVEIKTLSFKENAEPVAWQCDGNVDFQISKGDRKDIGTDVILHVNKDSEDFLDEAKIKDLVKRYSNFLPVEIQVNGKKANEQTALWNNAPSKTKEKEYNDFYKKLFPYSEDPLFHVHLSVDYPFNLKGILYFPKIKKELDITTKGRLKLFCNNVFVSDNIIDIIPQYLHLLQGVIDSPDIPLNISRSFLQNDPKVQKIGRHIAAKIADKLKQIYKKDKKKYEEYWQHINPFVKFAALSEEKFYEKVKDIILFKTTENEHITLDEYKEKNKKLKDKVLYTSNQEEQVFYINKAKAEGYTVLVLDSPIDNHFMQHLEMKNSPLSFMRVDSDFHEEPKPTKDDKNKDGEKENPDEKKMTSLFQNNLNMKELQVKLKELNSSASAMITQSEHMRRFSEMSRMMQGQPGNAGLMQNHTLVLNKKNPVIQKLLKESGSPEKDKQFSNICKNIYDLALLQQNNLKGGRLDDFIKRTTKIIEKDIK